MMQQPKHFCFIFMRPTLDKMQETILHSEDRNKHSQQLEKNGAVIMKTKIKATEETSKTTKQLTINALNFPFKRHCWLNGSRNKLHLTVVYNKFSFKDRFYLRVKEHTKVLQSNGTKKQGGVVILLSDKIGFKLKLTRRVRRTLCSSNQKNN